ncbi:MAG: ABC transporter permease, partial [Pyrinomonadaceae bacterium]
MNLVTSNIRQRPIRTLISVVSVALGVTLVMLFTGFTRGMSNDMQRRATNWRAEILFTRPGAMELTSSTPSVSTGYVERLKRIEGVAEAIPVITYVSAGKAGFGFELIDGVDWDPFARMNQMQILEGRAPQANTEVIIDETRKKEKKTLDVGGTIRLFGNRDYQIVGVFAPQSGARVKMTLNALQD